MLRLAKVLGKTVHEIENTMSVSELKKWAVYLSQEHSNSIEIQLALLTTVVANAMGGKAKIEDFLVTQYKVETKKVTTTPMSAKDVRAKFSNLL